MKKEKALIFVGLFLLLTIQLISAVPKIPHQIYGSVIVNDASAPDNNIILAEVDGEEYTTVTYNGGYGFTPNNFFVEDPEGDNENKTVTIYVGGKEATSFIFKTNGYDKIDLELTTTIGDGFCLGQETCANAPEDCGVCEELIVQIISPENTTYTENKVNLAVSSNQNILVWLYSINSLGYVTFQPNITLTLNEGLNFVEVMGVSSGDVATSSIYFTIDFPDVCGDGLCSSAESCSTCSQDCGTCGGSSSGSSGGSSGGGSSSSSSGSGTQTTNDSLIYLSTDEQNDYSDETKEKLEEEIEESEGANIQEESQNKNVFSKITGAVIAFGDKYPGLRSSVVVAFVVILFIVFTLSVRNKYARRKQNQ